MHKKNIARSLKPAANANANLPCSRCTTSLKPNLGKWKATDEPTMPPPHTTTWALEGSLVDFSPFNFWLLVWIFSAYLEKIYNHLKLFWLQSKIGWLIISYPCCLNQWVPKSLREMLISLTPFQWLQQGQLILNGQATNHNVYILINTLRTRANHF